MCSECKQIHEVNIELRKQLNAYLLQNLQYKKEIEEMNTPPVVIEAHSKLWYKLRSKFK